MMALWLADTSVLQAPSHAAHEPSTAGGEGKAQEWPS